MCQLKERLKGQAVTMTLKVKEEVNPTGRGLHRARLESLYVSR
eukprot:gene9668-biopygen4878